MDTETESYKYVENETVAWELTGGFRDKAFMKNMNGTLGNGDFYSGRMAVIKGS
jgi:hypothetical protein